MGKLIVFEGIDGSGKTTQCSMLCSALENRGVKLRRLTFPRYSEPSSALIRMYLGGEFGDDPAAVNAYAASTFFAVDRYASYAQDWRGFYEEGGLLITDRYTTSNAIHQGSKLPPEERESFFRWLTDFEFGLIGLPAPDAVIYLDIPLSLAEEHMRSREAQTGTSADIHEKNTGYLAACAECASLAAKSLGWRVVPAVDPGGARRTAEEIHREILGIADGIIGG